MYGAILLAFIFIAGSLAACGNKKVAEETGASEDVILLPETTEEETTTRQLTPIEVKDPNPLTGLEDLPNEAIGKRPVAVMINNIVDALPQYGVEQAEIIMEIPVEQNLTRLMAFYSDYQNLPDICSVRSCRYYFPAIAKGFDAVYVHWGIDFTVYDYVDGLGMNRYDLDNAYETYDLGLSVRDQERIDAGYAWEHTSEFLGSMLPKALEREGVDMNVKDAYKGTFFNFDPYKEPVIPDGDKCTYVDIDFGAQSSQFEFDEASHTYFKSHTGKPHVDGKSGKQYAYTNVIILETEVKDREDGYHKSVDWQGGKNSSGYYITEGAMQKISWSKESEEAKLKLFDENGDELVINRGKTYIAFNNPGNAKFRDK